MGLYDCRCMVSGVSLKAAKAALVLLQQTRDASYHPIALAIKGDYNRLGSIDGIAEDANTERVRKYFWEKAEGGQLIFDADYLRGRRSYPAMDVEDLLSCFERNINDYDKAALLYGRPVVFALICRAVWDRLGRAEPAARRTPTQRFRRLFRDVPVAQEIYRGGLMRVPRQLRELSAVSGFLARRRLAWRPSGNEGQDTAAEMKRYLEEARAAFRGSPVMREALNDYEREVAEFLREQEVRPRPPPDQVRVRPGAPGVAEGVAAEIDRRLAEARAPRSPNAFTAAEVRELALEYHAVYDKYHYTTEPYWYMWLAEARPSNALFAALLFDPENGVEFLCGTGHADAIREFIMRESSHDLNWVSAELSRRFTVPGGSYPLSREAAEAWLGRSW